MTGMCEDIQDSQSESSELLYATWLRSNEGGVGGYWACAKVEDMPPHAAGGGMCGDIQVREKGLVRASWIQNDHTQQLGA